MTRNSRPVLGSPWVESVLPFAIGAVCALILNLRVGAPWTLLVVPALCWFAWQIACRIGVRLGIRVVFVPSLGLAILGYMFRFYDVDTGEIFQAVTRAGVGVKTVSSERSAVIISIQPVSWGPERNIALRAIFAAAHSYAKSKKRVSIQWGDAMTTTVEMSDIEAFMTGQITYREMLNHIDWTGTPDILPDELLNRETKRDISQTSRLVHASLDAVASVLASPQPVPLSCCGAPIGML